MGASQSKSTVDIINEAIINATISAANNCNASVNQTQIVEHTGFGLFSGAKQTLNTSVSCLQKVVVDNDLITKMANDIQQQASASAKLLLPGYSSSDANTKIRNRLQTLITTQFVQNCASSAVQFQYAKFGGVQIGVVDTQTATVFQQCMMDALNKNQVAQQVGNGVYNMTESSLSTNPIADIFSSLGWALLLPVIIIIVIIIVAILLIKLAGTGGSSGSPGPPLGMMAMEAPTGPMGPAPLPDDSGFNVVELPPDSGMPPEIYSDNPDVSEWSQPMDQQPL